VMSQSAESLLAALVTQEPGQPPLVTATGPAKARPPTAELPSSGPVSLGNNGCCCQYLNEGFCQISGQRFRPRGYFLAQLSLHHR
jgi:hypothetical protein